MRYLNQKPTSLPTLQHNGISLESSASKASASNDYNYSCFNHCFCPLTESDFSFQILYADYCPKELLCTEESTFTLLAELDVSKSARCDSISADTLNPLEP